MIETELDLLRENRAWQRLLDLYRRQLEAQKAEMATLSAAATQPAEAAAGPPAGESGRGEVADEASADGAPEESCEESNPGKDQAADDASRWVPRVVDLEDVPPEELSQMHGQLIAWGFLDFELAGRTSGVRYRLTRLGAQLMNRLEQAEAADTCDAIPA